MSNSKVYAGNVSSRAREEDISHLFGIYGPVTKIELKEGFCFIVYDNPKDADDAVEKLNGYEFMGHRLNVEISKGGRGGGMTNQSLHTLKRRGFAIKCENLPPNTTWQDLKDYGREAAGGGPRCVNFAEVYTDPETGRKKGVIDFGEKANADSALRHGRSLYGERVEFTYATDEDVHRFQQMQAGKGPGGGRRDGRDPPRDSRDGGYGGSLHMERRPDREADYGERDRGYSGGKGGRDGFPMKGGNDGGGYYGGGGGRDAPSRDPPPYGGGYGNPPPDYSRGGPPAYDRMEPNRYGAQNMGSREQWRERDRAPPSYDRRGGVPPDPPYYRNGDAGYN